MGVRSRHVLFSGVLLAIVLMLGFAAGFLVDAAHTNSTYDALAVHRVAVSGKELGCAVVGSTGRFRISMPARVCRIAYRYRGTDFTEVIGYGQSQTAFVDPNDPVLHMTKASFDNGPTETTGDVLIAVLLVAGAIAVAFVHELHRHRRRAGRRGRA